jgi:hypothetical protein
MDLNYLLQDLIFNYLDNISKMKIVNSYIFDSSISIDYLLEQNKLISKQYINYAHIEKNSNFIYLIQKIHNHHNICEICDIFMHNEYLIKFNVGCQHRFICWDCYWNLKYCDECNDHGYGCQICLTNICRKCDKKIINNK